MTGEWRIQTCGSLATAGRQAVASASAACEAIHCIMAGGPSALFGNGATQRLFQLVSHPHCSRRNAQTCSQSHLSNLLGKYLCRRHGTA
jgi:hypothetical protein